MEVEVVLVNDGAKYYVCFVSDFMVIVHFLFNFEVAGAPFEGVEVNIKENHFVVSNYWRYKVNSSGDNWVYVVVSFCIVNLDFLVWFEGLFHLEKVHSSFS